MTALVALTQKLAQRLDMGDGNDLIDTLKATAFKGQVSDAQMTALMIVANQYSLNPWTREIYAFPDRNNGIVPVVGVDGWARIINEHPQFDGMDFEQDGEACTCIIYRKDRTRPVKVTEYMAECKRDTQPWKSHPRRMLRHKATIQCARLAFGYAGIFDHDEAERIVDMGPANVVRQTPTEIAAASLPAPAERDEALNAIIFNLEMVAKSEGDGALAEEWAMLTKEQRRAIGSEELERLKAIAAAVVVEGEQQ
ncbi:Phage recombination protein Bet [Cupriavidus oxalaticus]|uniref:phage recombination protein Bet n=1 Tax=Cupriavidus oxalaticus TaxID=96344 RepID=UPI003F73761C